MDTVSQYFMAQRITPDQKQYMEKLTVLHKLMLSAMKSKQTLDLNHIESMRTFLEEFRSLYFEDNHSH
jgi:nickel superoxide dismutase